jgi:hypothetical protein
VNLPRPLRRKPLAGGVSPIASGFTDLDEDDHVAPAVQRLREELASDE